MADEPMEEELTPVAMATSEAADNKEAKTTTSAPKFAFPALGLQSTQSLVSIYIYIYINPMHNTLHFEISKHASQEAWLYMNFSYYHDSSD